MSKTRRQYRLTATTTTTFSFGKAKGNEMVLCMDLDEVAKQIKRWEEFCDDVTDIKIEEVK